MKIVVTISLVIFLMAQVFSFLPSDKERVSSRADFKDSYVIVSECREGTASNEYEDFPGFELNRGDQWVLSVDDYDMTPNIYSSFEVEVKVEDVLDQGDEIFHIISYWPSGKIRSNFYRFTDFGSSLSLSSLSKTDFEKYSDYDGRFGIIEWVNKSSNRVSKRQLFVKNKTGENLLLREKKMNASATWYGNGRGHQGPEYQLPLMRFPYKYMKDTCWGSISDLFPEQVMSDTLKLKESCDTVIYRYSKYWKEDSLVIEFRTRSSFEEEYKFRSRLYWVKDSKWWVKHESSYSGPGDPNVRQHYEWLGFARRGRFLDVRLKEEKLSSSRD